MSIDTLVKISKFAGMREDLAQAGGGNSSVKLNDCEMLIKASGCQLSEVDRENGYAKVNYREIAEFLQANEKIAVTDAAGKAILAKTLIAGERPSIETFLHSITAKVTLHTHPLLVNVLTARKNGKSIIKKLFPNALWVAYATPGIKLAQVYYESWRQAKINFNTQIIFLQNHGLLVSGRSADEVIAATNEVVERIAKFLAVDNRIYQQVTELYEKLVALGAIKADKILYRCRAAALNGAARKYAAKLWEYSFCPDAVVYMGKKILALDVIGEENLTKWLEQNGYPTVIIYSGEIYIAADNLKQAKDIEDLVVFTLQAAELNAAEDISLLTAAERNILLNWEAEKYRRHRK